LHPRVSDEERVLMTSTEDQQKGYALGLQFYGIGEFTKYMRDRLSKLTLDDV